MSLCCRIIDRDALPYERLLPDARDGQVAHERADGARASTRARWSSSARRARSRSRSCRRTNSPAPLLELRAGDAAGPARSCWQHLISLGYEPEAEVEDVGQVSHRGGIVDFFPPALERPVRVEFFGDEIESIRTFDPETQRSLNPQEAVLVGPAREALATQRAAGRASSLPSSITDRPEPRRARALAGRPGGAALARSRSTTSPSTCPTCTSRPRCSTTCRTTACSCCTTTEAPRHDRRAAGRAGRGGARPAGARGRESAGPASGVHRAGDAQRAAAHRAGRCASPGCSRREAVGATPLGSALAPDLLPRTSYGGRLRAFAQDVRKLLGERQRVVIVSAQARRVAELFGDEALLGTNGVRARLARHRPARPAGAGTLAVVHGTLRRRAGTAARWR